MKVILDTNIIFSGIYKLDSNAGRILLLGIENKKIELFAPEHVQKELVEILEKKLKFSDSETKEVISVLPIIWIEEAIYKDKLKEASKLITDKKDVPILACALALKIDIISSDRHFQKIKTKKIKVWKLKQGLDQLRK